MKDILVLTNGTTIEFEAGASLSNMQVIFENKTSMVETWDKFTDENLKSVQIKDSNGTVTAEYSDLVLSSVTSAEKEDGTILTTFALREKTKLELDVEELKKDMAAINEVMGG